MSIARFGKLIGITAAWLLLWEAPALAGPITYTAVDIGVLPGATSTFGYAINSSGQVTGESYQPAVLNGPHTLDDAFLYTPGTGMQDLGTLPGAANTSAGKAINASGQVTGISTYGDGTRFHAFLYTPGLGMTDLGSLPGADSSDGYGINTSGQVTGDSYNSTFRPTNEQVVLYTKGSGMTAAVSTSQQGAGNAINDKGQIAGIFYVPTTLGGQAFVYTPGSGTVDLGTFSGANAINATGQVAGYSGGAGSSHAFLYTPGSGLQDLGTLGGVYGAESDGESVNDQAQVTGQSYTDANGHLSHAFLYTGGTMYDLNNLVTSGLGAGVSLTDADGINDNGWIIANASDSMSYLLEPNAPPPAAPEPRSLALLALGSVLLVGIRWRTVRSGAKHGSTSSSSRSVSPEASHPA